MPRSAPLEPWRRNVYLIALSQVSSTLGYTCTRPLLPLFMLEVGARDAAQAALWLGIGYIGTGVGLFFLGPIWGLLGDRIGRKINIMRAMYGSSLILVLMALSREGWQVAALMFVQGCIGGTIFAGMAVAASTTPRERIGYAMGIIQAAPPMAAALGSVISGVLADAIGIRLTLVVYGAVFQGLGGVIAHLWVREEFHPPPREEAVRQRLAFFRNLGVVLTDRSLLGLLGVTFLISALPALAQPMLPLFIRELTETTRPATFAGLAFALVGPTASLSAYTVARLTLRGVSLRPLLVLGCLLEGLLYLPMLVVGTVPQVILVVGSWGLTSGALVTITNALVGEAIPKEKYGTTYGVVQSASSSPMGWGPAAGGLLASAVGLRQVFLVNAVLFVVAAPVALLLVPARAGRSIGTRPGSEGRLSGGT